MIFYESTSSSIIGKPQIEKVNQLQLKQVYSQAGGHNVFAIKGVVSGSEPSSDDTLPTEAYVRTYVENNITSTQNHDLSDTVSFLQIISAPLNNSKYHNFIQKTDTKTVNLDFSEIPLMFLNEGEIYTCEDNLTSVIDDNLFTSPLYAKFNFDTKNINNLHNYSTMFESILASQDGWVSPSSTGGNTVAGDYCVAFPSNNLSSDTEYTYISYDNITNKINFADQFFDTPRGQFINLQTSTRTSCKLVPTNVCTAYKLIYVFIVKINNIWTLMFSKTKPTIFNKTPNAIIEDAWYFDNMTQCWFTGKNNGLLKRLACFVGILAVDAMDVIAAWNMPPAQLINPYNTVRLNQLDVSTINTVSEINTVNIFNKKVNVTSDLIKPDMNLLSKCIQCYIYVDLQGNFQTDWKHPYENAFGEYYHPINYWKCVGEFYVDSNKLISNVLDLHEQTRYDDAGQLMQLTYEFPQAFIRDNPYNEYSYQYCRHFFAPLDKNLRRNLAYYTITFASAGGNGYRSDISNETTYATLTSSFNDLIACLEDGKRGNENSAGSNNYGISAGTKYCANNAISSTGARSTALNIFDVNKYAKGGNSYIGFGGNSGNVFYGQISAANLPECFIKFGEILSLTNNSLGYLKIELNYYKDN